MQYRLATKNTFLHVEEVEMTRERATSDLTDVMLEEGVQRRQTATKSIEEAIQKGEVTPTSSLSPKNGRHGDTGSECSTNIDGDQATDIRSRLSASSEQEDGLAQASTPVVQPSPQPQTAQKDRRRRKNDLYPLDDDVTLMLRNIPNKYTQEQLRQDLEPFRMAIDFLYLPTDFKNNCNLGYAFLNFSDGKVAEKFAAQYNGNRLPRFPHSPKVLAVQCARVQGVEANVERFRDSSVMGVRDETMKPMLFQVGEPIPFPAPNGDLPPIGARRKRGPSRFQQAKSS
jgi:RNA recognition motif-containing protein